MSLSLRFQAVSNSWIAIHPHPKGTIQFIGGAFFGTFGPMLFYRHLLRYFWDQSYTLILLPFNFTFNHYREAGFLVKEQYKLLPDLIRIAFIKGYEYTSYLSEKNYVWMGHSLGCKYIALLEGLSALPEDSKNREIFIRDLLTDIHEEPYSEAEIQSVISDINNLIEELNREIHNVQKQIRQYANIYLQGQAFESVLDFSSFFVKNQRSILFAPDSSDTASAIKPKMLANLIDDLGLGVNPTPAVTKKLIRMGDFFNLLGLICFKQDNIARQTCQWFTQNLGKPPQEARANLCGGHLQPLGIRVGSLVFNPLSRCSFLSSIYERNKFLESHVDELLIFLSKIETKPYPS